MIVPLAFVKDRLAIPGADETHNFVLNRAIEAIGATFLHLTQRGLARAENCTHEFAANETEINVRNYPIETVTLFALKSNELSGWVLLNPPDFLVRRECVISLRTPLGTAHQQARVTYTGGYVLPDAVPGPGQVALPADLQHAAIEQVACWFINRDKLGLVRNWPSGGVYQQFIQAPLLPWVEATLRKYERWDV